MGLFNKKKKDICPLCEQEIGLLNSKISIANNDFICNLCRSFLGHPSSSLSDVGLKSLEKEYWSKKESMNSKLEHFSKFEPNIKVGTWAEFDDKNRIAAFRTGFSSKPNYKVNYEDIEDFSVIENGKSIVKSGAASAAAGGILFGPTGAIVGGLLTRGNKKESCSMLKVSIAIKNESRKEIVLINTKTKADSTFYKLSQGSLKSIVTKLDKILSPSTVNTRPVEKPIVSSADEIRKFKQLLDDGILTQEEFETKKKELLNL